MGHPAILDCWTVPSYPSSKIFDWYVVRRYALTFSSIEEAVERVAKVAPRLGSEHYM
jgi:hypothetical protein